MSTYLLKQKFKERKLLSKTSRFANHANHEATLEKCEYKRKQTWTCIYFCT